MERTVGPLACLTVGLWLGLLLLCSWGFPGSAEPRAPPENIGKREGGGARRGRWERALRRAAAA